MEKIKLPIIQKLLYEYILQEYQANGKFIETNRQLARMFERTPHTMKYDIKKLQEKGLISCKTVLEDSGYIIRYITPTQNHI